MSGNSGFCCANMKTLKDSEMRRYYNKEHPSFFATLPREDRDLCEMKLHDNFINGIEESIPSKVILILANGHETYVSFKRSEQSLFYMKEFNIECCSLFGSVMIYSYKGNGKFFVNCLKDDLCEVIYFKNRIIPRGTFYDQDLVTGIGWKFLVFLNNPAVQVGEINQIWRLFRFMF
ncbi:uncharacterized protein LOC141661597 [Apium graveolens]|uniref:uncharacterized protein LOC141661597 n=1 Tax=Apium graveolens TaxID=4045 RepID=UPI003D794251